jgi:hypothetical protein
MKFPVLHAQEYETGGLDNGAGYNYSAIVVLQPGRSNSPALA